jgi:hypothetical protein
VNPTGASRFAEPMTVLLDCSFVSVNDNVTVEPAGRVPVEHVPAGSDWSCRHASAFFTCELGPLAEPDDAATAATTAAASASSTP